MTLYLLRHGQKEPGYYFNASLGYRDNPLSPTGMRQAQRVAERFASHPPTKIFVSPLVRTSQTAAPLAEKTGLVPIPDTRLMEIHMGVLSRLPEEQVQDQFPEFWKAYREKSADYRYPEGETGAEVLFRLLQFLEDRISDEAMIIAHDGLIRCFLCHLQGWALHRRHELKIANASVTTVDWNAPARTGVVRNINDISHLDGLVTYDP